MNDFENIVSFLREYESFFANFKLAEREKLQNLTTWDLDGIEHSISVQQANEKKMENLEAKRQQLQVDLKMEELSFSEVIEKSPERYKNELKSLFSKTESSVNEIKYLNKKSMSIVKGNIKMIGKKLPQDNDNPVAREYHAANGVTRQRQSRIEIKI